MNMHNITQDFPILLKRPHGKRLAYLDNAATTQKPQCVIDALTHYYENINAGVHRGTHYLSEAATLAFEQARTTVQKFINAKDARECIFVRGTTEAINLVASSFGAEFIKPGDEILISAMEHHSNIVPWQMLCQRQGAKLKVIPMNKNGELILDNLEELLGPKTKLLALTHVSNVLGTLNPIADIIRRAHAHDIPVLVDGAQSIPHLKIDVQALDCDFFVFSGHKVYGPTGIGILYGKEKWLEKMPPFQGGGGMIRKVSFDETLYAELPAKFEAGVPAIAEGIALGKALEYLSTLPWHEVKAKEAHLLRITKEALLELPAINLIGNPVMQISLLSFVMKDVHPHDIGTILDQAGVAVRTGHHCAMPVMDFFKVPATVRVSIGLYNTEEDIVQLIAGLKAVQHLFKIKGRT